VRTSDAEAGERNVEQSGNDCRADSEGVVVEFEHSMSISTNIDIQIFGDFELAGWCSFKGCNVFDEICVNSEREIESCSKDFNGCSSLGSDTKSSFKRCRPRRAQDGQAVSHATSATVRLASDLEEQNDMTYNP
jgi:hypothetical protein